MDAKRFLKWAAFLAAVVGGMIYLASALLVSEKVASLFDFRSTEIPVFRMVADDAGKENPGRLPVVDAAEVNAGNGTMTGNGSSPETKPGHKNGADASTGAASYRLVPESGSMLAGFLPNFVRLVLLVAFLLAPAAIFYVFLFRPFREIPLVGPDAIAALDDNDPRRRKEAGLFVAEAMLSVSSCPEKDRRILRCALERPTDIDKTVKKLLAEREATAKQKAVEIAKMAGLTVAASSSAAGDGLGMFFWKSKLVFETFRIYGFRPDARTTISIWAHVVFASLFAASVEELCELCDMSGLLGGIGGRVFQGVVGAGIVLKGGALTRTYLLNGISSDSRHLALSGFKDEFGADVKTMLSDTVERALPKIVQN